MTAVTETTSARFSKALRSMTWEDHEKAEYTDFMQQILDGQAGIAAYADMVAQHYFAYVVIEEAGEAMRNDPVAGPFVHDSLMRLPALKADLENLLGADWLDKIEPNEATKEYLDRLREVCFTWPGGYVAHSYTRYLGDLSGGQTIRAAVNQAYGFENNSGSNFYVFSDIPDYAAFKMAYRQALDTAPWDAEEQQRVVDETLLAYKLNTKVLAELGRKYLAK